MKACLWGKQWLEKRTFLYIDCFWTVCLAHVWPIQNELTLVPEWSWSAMLIYADLWSEGHSPLCLVSKSLLAFWLCLTSPTDKPCLEHFGLSLLWRPCHIITFPHLLLSSNLTFILHFASNKNELLLLPGILRETVKWGYAEHGLSSQTLPVFPWFQWPQSSYLTSLSFDFFLSVAVQVKWVSNPKVLRIMPTTQWVVNRWQLMLYWARATPPPPMTFPNFILWYILQLNPVLQRLRTSGWLT